MWPLTTRKTTSVSMKYMSPIRDALAAELRVEDFAKVQAHLLADHLAGPLGGDKNEAHHHPHGDSEGDFAADADGQLPRRIGQRHRLHAPADAQAQDQRQQHFHPPRDARAAEQRRIEHHSGQPEEDQHEDGDALEDLKRHGRSAE